MTYNEELRFRQDRFLRHIQYLLAFIRDTTDLTLSTGRAHDIPEVQPILIKMGLSATLDSMHAIRLAWDINFFLNGYYLFSDDSKREEDFRLVEPIGEYWESLDKDNRWGGRFKKPFDPNHFENKFY